MLYIIATSQTRFGVVWVNFLLLQYCLTAIYLPHIAQPMLSLFEFKIENLLYTATVFLLLFEF